MLSSVYIMQIYSKKMNANFTTTYADINTNTNATSC